MHSPAVGIVTRLLPPRDRSGNHAPGRRSWLVADRRIGPGVQAPVHVPAVFPVADVDDLGRIAVVQLRLLTPATEFGCARSEALIDALEVIRLGDGGGERLSEQNAAHDRLSGVT